ncbi:DUF397 domain-containing protein [Streptomyces fuscichromogenes]|uniref:DUF397 domain-containing protein n=1 Tax=Streptomyces fuscichromogenes TaxID=1324013 RepID=UPI0035712443
MAPDNWRRSSYSGSGDGNNCVEVAHRPTCISLRDSKAPSAATLTFPSVAFASFLRAIKGARSTAS